jgi:methionine sulfoxide reductase heme-binding subunit
MRLWRAVGDAGLILLFLALVLGPLAKLWPQALRLLPYRRELGVWFGLFAFLHTLLVLNGWARWDALRFLGYEFVPQLGRVARLEPGFGLSNLLGLVAMLFTLVLMATSTDWAVRRLGGKAWKFLQLSSYIVFYLSALHTAYFLFMHYTMSFHRQVPSDPNWFRWPFLALTLGVIALQVSAYMKRVELKSTLTTRHDPSESPKGLR